MIETYKAVYAGKQGEISEKKSRFICTVRAVNSEEEAVAFIEEMKKKYYDAAHNCSAFVIGRKAELTRCSDDGEPSGTAGRPMLEVLLLEEIRNIAVVVTRYFGGTLLGTGGLVRAYQRAVKEGIAQSIVIEKKLGVKLCIKMDYHTDGKVRYLLGENKIPILDAVYTDGVILTALVPVNQKDRLKAELTEATAARINIEETQHMYFALVNKELTLFDEKL